MNATLASTIAVAALVSLISPRPATAAAQWHTSTVKFVYPLSDGEFVLGFSQESQFCTNVSNPKYYLVAVGQNGVTADGLKGMLATSLLAFAMQKQVSINFDDATSNCFINRLIVQ